MCRRNRSPSSNSRSRSRSRSRERERRRGRSRSRERYARDEQAARELIHERFSKSLMEALLAGAGSFEPCIELVPELWSCKAFQVSPFKNSLVQDLWSCKTFQVGIFIATLRQTYGLVRPFR
jgi:hypothetical protein